MRWENDAQRGQRIPSFFGGSIPASLYLGVGASSRTHTESQLIPSTRKYSFTDSSAFETLKAIANKNVNADSVLLSPNKHIRVCPPQPVRLSVHPAHDLRLHPAPRAAALLLVIHSRPAF